MRVAKAFAEERFEVIQSRYFEDPEEGKLREIDLTAARLEVEDGFMASVVFAVECKSSPDKPWVLLSSADRERPSLLQSFQGSALVSQSVTRDYGHVMYRSDPSIPVIHPGPRYGYGVTQAFTSGVDVPYKAVRSAVKSAVARVHETGESDEYTFVVPVVVFEGRLFECRLDKEGRTLVDEIESGTLWWRSSVAGFDRPKVRIVTETALPAFIEQASAFARNLIEYIYQSPKANRVIDPFAY